MRTPRPLPVGWWLLLGLLSLGAGLPAALTLAPAGWTPWLETVQVLGVLVALTGLARATARARRREHEARLALVVAETMNDGLMVLDEAGRCLYRNPSFRDNFQAGLDRPVDVLEGMVPEDSPTSEELRRLRDSAALGDSAHAEIALPAPAGDTAWWRFGVIPLGEGRVAWRAVDVTARRVMERTLRGELEALLDMMDHLPAGYFMCDGDGRMRFVNASLASWFGITPQGLLQERPRLADLLPGVEPNSLTAEGRLVTLTLPGEEDEVRALLSGGVLRESGTRRFCGLLLRRDRLARRPTLEDRPGGDLFRDAPIAIALLDSLGTITEANLAFLRQARLDRGMVIGRPLAAFLSMENPDEVVRRLAAKAARNDSRPQDLRLATGDEPTLSAFVGLRQDDAGEPVGFLLYLVDITSQRHLEVQFAHAQKIQAMGQLAGGVAHDFNNLLTAIIGFCDLLLQRHAAGDPSFSDIMQIKQNANRAANLVRQLLAFSRRQTLRPRVIDVAEALTELSHLLRRLLGETISLDLVLGRDVGPIRVDPGQFDQVIINLAVNARDAMPHGGRLVIRTYADHITAPQGDGPEYISPGAYAVVEVADTGEGMSAETRARIFEPFFSTKPKGEGTGLGLSTVYGIVRQTNGFIQVASTPGEGTLFTIHLPRHEGGTAPRTSETEGAKSQEDLTGAGTLLLVEDEDAVRVFATRALRNKGYQVLEAKTGEGALSLFESEKAANIRLLITDVVMPGIDGLTLARQVRQDHPTLPVILISGYAEDVARETIAADDAVHFLAKPFSLKDLAARVKKVLAGTATDSAPAEDGTKTEQKPDPPL